jgi:hypothetical protein
VAAGFNGKLAPTPENVCAGCGAKVIVCGPIGTKVFVAADSTLSPIAFVALTRQKPESPLVRPVTTMGEAVPVVLSAPHIAV